MNKTENGGLWWHNSDLESFLSWSKLVVIAVNLYKKVIVFCVKTDRLWMKNNFFLNSKFYETNKNSFFHRVNLDEIVNLNIMEKKKTKTAKYLNLIYSVIQNYLYKPGYINALKYCIYFVYSMISNWHKGERGPV